MKHIKKLLVFMFVITCLSIWVILAKGQGKVEPKLIMEKTFSEDVLYSALEEENGELIPKFVVTKSKTEFFDKRGGTKLQKVIKVKEYGRSDIRFSKNKKCIVAIEREASSKPAYEDPGICLFTIMNSDGNVLRTFSMKAIDEEMLCHYIAFYISDDGRNIAYIPYPGSLVFMNDKGEKKEMFFSEGEVMGGAWRGDFSDDNNLFAFNTGYYVILYDFRQLDKEPRLWKCKICDGHPAGGNVRISPDNKYICVTNDCYTRVKATFNYHCISIDGQLLWSKEEKQGPVPFTNAITFSPDNKYLSLSLPDNRIGVFESATGETKWVYNESTPGLRPGVILKLSNNSRHLVSSVKPFSGKYYETGTHFVYLFDDNGNRIWAKEFDRSSYSDPRVWEMGPEIMIDKEGTKFAILNGKQYQTYFLK